MLTDERYRLILEQLLQEDFVSNQTLIDLLDVSESTIRRDLSLLEKEGKLYRVHGGAKAIERSGFEHSFEEKGVLNFESKLLIARESASLIKDNQMIYLDAGTTTLAMIPFIETKHLTVVTNGLKQAEALSQRGYHPILLGGKVKALTGAILGPTARQQLSRYCFHQAFIGANGLHLKFGLTTPDEEEAELKRQAISLSQDAYFLVDSSKFNRVHFTQIVSADEARIITDQIPDQLRANYLSQLDIKEVDQ